MAAVRPAGSRWPWLLGAALVVATLAALLWTYAGRPGLAPEHASTPLAPGAPESMAVAATYVADAQCGECHAKAVEAWRGSHHQRAMQPANAQTVLGDFANKRLTHRGMTTQFTQRDGRYFITTEGRDGKPAEFEVQFTFGVEPLQQYLVAFPGGRLQAPTVAWDTQNKRWFALYPKDRHKPDDPLHSTGRYQNWNLMCSECHSTDLRRNYDAANDSYDTKWAQINVGCQACHGPGSAHVAWAKAAPGKVAIDLDARAMGLVVDFRGNDSRYQVEACAPCHSRRQRLTDGELPGKPFLDNYHPALLREGLYYADGQQQDEVYVWGSFLQTKMYAQGVRCTDCHAAHDLKLKLPGNALCAQCHQPAGNPRFPTLAKQAYDTPAHHHHAPGSAGAQCTNCHMPSKNYMVIDARADHSFRIPRPDLSVKIGTPNACNGCHDKKTPHWAADAVAKWYGPNRRQEPTFAETFAAARGGAPAALSGLDGIVSDRAQPAIVRATALDLARAYGPAGGRLAIRAKNDADALVRAAAAAALAAVPAQERFPYAAPLLSDPIKLVRIEAARALADIPLERIPDADRAAFDSVWNELIASERSLSDMPAMRMNLAGLAWRRGDAGAAEGEYRRVIEMDPYLAPAYNALASVLSAQRRNADAEAVLREGLRKAPDNGDLHSSLGLLLAEEGRDADAAAQMEHAAKLSPSNARIFYNLGLIEQRRGDLRASVVALAKARALGDAEATYALALLEIKRNRPNRALPLIEELVAANPGNAQLAKMRDDLRRETGR
ncbi:MAG: tetratricopeptide repeat protein [Burkholderiales bacterium]|nr:tetratricopeptide repeat protein [Burkholderiales bacterium]